MSAHRLDVVRISPPQSYFRYFRLRLSEEPARLISNYLPRYRDAARRIDNGIRTACSHSCGWLYVEKKVDKLSPGSLKAWAGRSTHSSRPLLLSLPPVSLLSSSTFFTDTPPPPPFAPSSSSMLYALSSLHSLGPSFSFPAYPLCSPYARFTSTLYPTFHSCFSLFVVFTVR